MRTAGDGADGARLRALIVILWRAGLRISEALNLAETNLDRSRGVLLIRRGKVAVDVRSLWIAGHGINSNHGYRSGQGFRSVHSCV